MGKGFLNSFILLLGITGMRIECANLTQFRILLSGRSSIVLEASRGMNLFMAYAKRSIIYSIEFFQDFWFICLCKFLLKYLLI